MRISEIKHYNINGNVIIAEYDKNGMVKITRECFESLIEKHKPKKPLISHFDFDNTDVAYCPNCNNAFGEIKPQKCFRVRDMKWHYRNGIKESHCEVCGQSIDWSEVSE